MATPLTIQDALKNAGEMLAADNDNPTLEASLLLAHTLGVARAHLHTRPEQVLRDSQQQSFFDLIARRMAGEPVAYLIGRREFWSLELTVNKHTLIPRPETELWWNRP